MVTQIKQKEKHEETLRIRIPRKLFDSIQARAVNEDRTRSDVARELLDAALSSSRTDADPYSIPVRDAVLLYVDAANNVLDRVSGSDPKEAVRLSMDAAIAFSKWAEKKAEELNTSTEAIYRGSIRR